MVPENICRRCGINEGTMRYYVPGLFSVSGTSMKLSVKETVGCDECWQTFELEMIDHAFNLGRVHGPDRREA